MNADCGEHMSPAEVTTLLNVVETTFAALAAENAGLKSAISEYSDGFTVCPCCGTEHDSCHDDVCRALNETPATDAFLAEVRAQGRNEGINYAASRLAAAYNHGFIGKSMSEVADVVHMILDTKEELENSTRPAADGLSGEYAEAFLEDIAAQLRKGVQS
ncbi:TPA: hypothetical protein QIC06_004807 [Enterobacter kobei]|nr:hypothetical protein D9T11_11385 [Enterobacter kobei]HDT0752742.1 hypothetical protein [Enterobacter kobei]HDV9098082.1 hypothetical protein [Enterobacter kobei]